MPAGGHACTQLNQVKRRDFGFDEHLVLRLLDMMLDVLGQRLDLGVIQFTFGLDDFELGNQAFDTGVFNSGLRYEQRVLLAPTEF